MAKSCYQITTMRPGFSQKKYESMISYSPYQWVENVCPLLCAHSLITSCAGSQTENKYLPATNKSNNSRCQQAQLAIEILSTGRILSNGNQMPMKRKIRLFTCAAQAKGRSQILFRQMGTSPFSRIVFGYKKMAEFFWYPPPPLRKNPPNSI